MMNKDYVLTIRIPFEAMDDLEARMATRRKLQEKDFLEEAEIKLQEVFKDKSPRKIPL
jgi:hypothetical protein